VKARRKDLAAALCGVVFALAAAGGVWATTGGSAACVDPVTGAEADAAACALPGSGR
jgi:hypothetical protein